MNFRFILLCLFFGFAGQAYSAPDGHDASVAVEGHAWTMAITNGELQSIPNKGLAVYALMIAYID